MRSTEIEYYQKIQNINKKKTKGILIFCHYFQNEFY